MTSVFSYYDDFIFRFYAILKTCITLHDGFCIMGETREPR